MATVSSDWIYQIELAMDVLEGKLQFWDVLLGCMILLVNLLCIVYVSFLSLTLLINKIG